jgi:hypothetical protein
MEHIIALCQQNAELVNVAASITYDNYRVKS